MIESKEVGASRGRSGALLALVFASGAAALILEVSWTRQVGLRIGQTATSAGVVLASYFAGLALGSMIGGRLSARVRPLFGYGVAELIVGGWAALVPLVLGAMQGAMARPPAMLSDGGSTLAIRALLCVSALLPATLAMGATLPLMAAHLSKGRLDAHRVARAYAWNTSGAAFGVIAATVLLVRVGVRGSGDLAAAISATCGLAACAMGRSGDPDDPVVEGTGRPSAAWGVLAGVSGFGTLGLEVLYNRMFALTFQNSTYTFGLVTAAFLGALAAGSALFGRWRRRSEAGRIAASASGFGALAVSGSALLFVGITGLKSFTMGTGWALYLAGASALVTVVVVPPVTALGVLLPACWEAAGSGRSRGGAVVGRLTAINGVGAAAGALIAGFAMLPTIGLWASFGALAGLFALASALLRAASGRKVEGLAVAALLAALILLAVRVPGQVRTLPSDPNIRIIADWEGPYGLTEVVDNGRGGKTLRHDLHYGLGSTGPATTREYRQGLLPLLLCEGPSDVLFLGLGTGLTAAPSTLHPGVRRAEVVELIPEVVEAARFFDPENLGVLDHPKVRVRIDDARHLLLAGGRRHDAIISDLFIPWESKAGYLYTVDFYRIVRARLAEGGLFCQWLPLYQLGRVEFAMIADSFATVFPETTLWWGDLARDKAIIALVGTERPLEPDLNRIDRLLPDLRPLLDDPDAYLGSAASLERLFNGRWPVPDVGTPLNTDEHPWVEFQAPIRQRDDALLTGDRLLLLFDEVLRELPAGGVRFKNSGADPSLEHYRRHVRQREALLKRSGR